MSAQHNERFDHRDVQLSNFAKAIGHPVRIMILSQLADGKNRRSSEIIDALPLAPSTVTQHLRDLKKAGLIRGRIYGENADFYLNGEGLENFLEQFEKFIGSLSKGNGKS